MVTAFQIILLIVLSISFLGVIGEKKDENLRNNLALIVAISIVIFVVSVVWL